MNIGKEKKRKEKKMSGGHGQTNFVSFKNLQWFKIFLNLAAFVMAFLIKFQTISEQFHAPKNLHQSFFFSVSQAQVLMVLIPA